MNKITIHLTNNRCKLSGDIKLVNKLRNDLRFRHPNAWFLRSHMPRGWDGFVYDISEYWTIRVGLIPKFIDRCNELNIEYEIIDNRENIKFNKIPIMLNDNFKLRDYQVKAVKALLNNKIGKTPFQIGVINAATNAGKTAITAAIHMSFNNAKTLVLLNSTDLFNQGLSEYPELLPGEDIGFIQGTKYNKWGNFTVAMVQTLSRNIAKYKSQISNIDIIIVDECDLADNKTYRNVLNMLFNTTVRVGLSGSVFLSKLKKHQLKNNNLMSFFGKELFTITKQDMIKKGYSSNLIIKILKGGKCDIEYDNYLDEYKGVISKNKSRENMIINRLEYNIKYGRIPILIICKYHFHVERLYKILNKHFNGKFNIGYVHHKIKDRKNIISDFKDGRIDILIASMIIKRGQNLPLIKLLINASGGDSEESVIQIMGRAERVHKSKKKTIIEDFYDEGRYLKRHSKHRINYYVKQGFKVIKLY